MRMKWMSLLGAVTLAVALASCSSIKNPLEPQTVFDLENAYGVVQGAAVAYSSLPACPATGASPVVCAKASVVKKLANGDRDARLALTALENFVRNPANYPGLTYAGLLEAAQTAVATLENIENQNGVK